MWHALPFSHLWKSTPTRPHVHAMQTGPQARPKKWKPADAPPAINSVFDGVEKSQLHRAVRETKQITENLMRELCPGWDWEKRTRHHSARDGKHVIRKPEDVTIEQVLEIFFTHDSFTTPLWKMIKGRTNLAAKDEVVEADLIPFLKVFCCLMFYKCTISEFYSDVEGMNVQEAPHGRGAGRKEVPWHHHRI